MGGISAVPNTPHTHTHIYIYMKENCITIYEKRTF